MSSVWKTQLKFTQWVPKATWWAGESLQTSTCKVSSSICVTSPGVPALKPCFLITCCQNLWKVFAEVNFIPGFPGKGWFHRALSVEQTSPSPGVPGRGLCILASPVLDGLRSVFVHSAGAGPGHAMWMHSEPGYPQGRALQPTGACTQQSYPGSVLPAAPVLPTFRPGACSCPGVNVLMGNKWVFPNSGLKIVQYLWSLLSLRFFWCS